MDKDRKELQERMIFEDRARMSSVLWVLGISQKDFDRIIANELKSGTAPAK